MKTFRDYLAETENKSKGTYAALNLSEKSKDRLYNWLEEHKVKDLCDPSEYHATVVYSRKEVPELESYKPELPIKTKAKGWHVFPQQNGGKCLVLDVDDDKFHAIHDYAKDIGATWDFPSFKPHITVVQDYKENDPPKSLPKFLLVFDSFYTEGLEL